MATFNVLVPGGKCIGTFTLAKDCDLGKARTALVRRRIRLAKIETEAAVVTEPDKPKRGRPFKNG